MDSFVSQKLTVLLFFLGAGIPQKSVGVTASFPGRLSSTEEVISYGSTWSKWS